MAQREVITLNEASVPPALQVPPVTDTYLMPRDLEIQGNLIISGTVDGQDVAATANLANQALQPGDNVSELVNDAGYQANAALASKAEAEAGVENTKTMTALRVAQAIAVLAADIKNNYTAVIAPAATDDTTQGYAPGSYWIDTVGEEVYRCIDATTNLAVWIKTTLSVDELATVAVSGDSDDLTEGVVQLLLTAAERVKLGYVSVTQAVDLDILEAAVNVLNGLFTVTDAIVAYASGGQANATLLGQGMNVVETVASAGDSVKLPPAVQGQRVSIMNNGVNYLNLFPASGDEIAHFPANTAVPISVQGTLHLIAINSNQWVSA